VDANLDPRGLLELALYPGVYDVELDLTSGGYLPGRLGGLVVGEGESREHELLLTRGLDRFVRLDPPPSAADGFGEHLVFLVHESELDAIAGPYPEQGPPSNRRINGICMRLDDPTLMEQLLSRDDFASTGKTRLFGLKPGRYVLKSYPDDYLFEPPALELSPTSPDELVLRWRRR
jgi:hypothetical protein